MDRSKTIALAVAVIVVLGLALTFVKHTESSSPNDDLKVLVEKNIQSPQVDPLIAMFALEIANSQNKKIDVDGVIQQFHAQVSQPNVMDKFEKNFSENFTDSEISELRKIYENPAFEKFSKESQTILQKNFTTMKEVLTDLISGANEEKAYYSKPSKIVELNDKNYEQTIKSGKPVIIDIYASWCQACTMMQPAYEETSGEYNNIVFAKLNYDNYKNLVSKYNVTGLPTLVFLKGNGESKTVVGYQTKEQLKSQISQFFKE